MRNWVSPILVVSMLAWASAADAQWRSERPYRGLFANGVDNSEQLLAASASVGAGWDDSLMADALGRSFTASDFTRQFKGGLGTGSAALSYSLNRGAVALGASAGSTLRYYPSISNSFVRREYAGAGASAVLGAGFTVRGAASYQPFSVRSMYPELFELGPADVATIDEDFPASLEHYFGYSAGGGYSSQLTQRDSFSASYGYSAREATSGVGRFAHHNAGAGLDHNLTQGLSVRLGYRYSQALYGVRSQRPAGHMIDAGLRYNRALSFSRSTTLSFGTGTTAVKTSRSDSLRYRATGSARINHELGRTWHASASYNRGMQFIDTWPEPLFSDAATAGVGGLLNRRTQVGVMARAMRGRSVLRSDGGQVESYGAGASLTVALTRHVNTGLTYSYYHHQFADAMVLAPGFPNDFERRSLRAFVSVWVPLFQRTRRTF